MLFGSARMRKIKRKEQINWLVDLWFDENMTSICDTDFDLFDRFEKETGADLTYRTWKERIKSVGDRLGLTRVIVGLDNLPCDHIHSGMIRHSNIYSICNEI